VGADRRAPQLLTPRADDDRGMVTAFVVMFSVALVFMVGLVFDGGRMLAAHRQARDVADAAARAGAQGLSEDAVRQGLPDKLDPEEAQALACTFLDRTAYKCRDANIRVEGNEVIVLVHGSVSLEFLPGVSTGVEEEGRACVAIGIGTASC
jgi:Flp pilus assembly protein TadG